MIYKLTHLTDEELRHLYIKESNQLLHAAIANNAHNFLQSIKVTVARIDDELERRKNRHIIRRPTDLPRFRAY